MITTALRRGARHIPERVLTANVLGNALADRDDLAHLLRYERLTSGGKRQLPEHRGILVGIVGVEDADREHLDVRFGAGLQELGKCMSAGVIASITDHDEDLLVTAAGQRFTLSSRRRELRDEIEIGSSAFAR